MNSAKIYDITRSNLTEIKIDNNDKNIIINIEKCNPRVSIINTSCNNDFKCTINISDNCNVKFNVFNYVNSFNQVMDVYLKGENSSLTYLESSINLDSSIYVMNIYHEASYTKSEISKRGLNKGSKLQFIINEYVSETSKDCVVSQKSRIINLSDGQCLIEPNLFTDNLDVVANHSATIGKFSEKEVFYLESRGINREDAIKLLIKGFLINDLSFVNVSIIYDMINKSLK